MDILKKHHKSTLLCQKEGDIDRTIYESVECLKKGNIQYFKNSFPSKEHWRLFLAFRSKTAYLDIEQV